MHKFNDGLNYRKIHINDLLIIALFIFLWILSPVISSIFLLLIFGILKTNKKIIFIIFLLVSSLMGILNATKTPVTDLQNYYNYFAEFNNINLFDYWKIRPIDPFFYLPTALISHLFNAYPPAFIFTWTLISYLSLAYSITGITSSLGLSRIATMSLLIFSMFFNFSFTLSGHLIRQYAAMSMLLLSISFLIQGRKNYFFIFILSALTHFSSLLFLPIFIIKINFLSGKNKLIILILSILGAAYLIGEINLIEIINKFNFSDNLIFNEVSERGHLYVNFESGGINNSLITEYIICYMIFIISYIKDEKFSRIGFIIFTFLSFYFSILLIFRNTGLLLDRYFFYGPIVPIISIPYIMVKFNLIKISLTIILPFLSIILFFKIIFNSEYVYITNDFNIFILTFMDFINYIK
jgi:hypothetical protein